MNAEPGSTAVGWVAATAAPPFSLKCSPPHRGRLAGVAALVALCLAHGPEASAQFVKIADFDTLVPGGSFLDYAGVFPAGSDRFNGFAAPAISGGSVVFVANASATPSQVLNGFFSARATGGGVSELVTRRTWLPEYTGPKSGPTAPNNAGEGVFVGFSAAGSEFKDDTLVFAASTIPTFGVVEVNANVYALNITNPTNLRHVLRAQDARLPSGTYSPILGVFGSSGQHVLHAGNPAGIYQITASGTSAVADSTMQIPGGASNFFVGAADIAADRRGVTFVAQAPTGGNAIWRKNDGAAGFELLRKSDLGGVLSDAPFAMLTFSQLRAYTHEAITFISGTAGNAQTGIFTQRTSTENIREAFATVATTAMAAPSGSGNYRAFSRIAASSVRQVVQTPLGDRRYLDTDVAFMASDQSNRNAIYAYLDDQVAPHSGTRQVQRLIGVGDLLDGKRIAQVDIGRNAISNGTVAFLARFEDASEAVYTVPVRAIIPRSGVVVETSAWRGSNNSRPMDIATGETAAAGSTSASDAQTTAVATGDGLASPLTGGVRVRALARVDGGAGGASTGVTATQRFLVLGENTGDEVDVDFNFSFSGVLGVSGTGLGLGPPPRAFVSVSAYVYQSGRSSLELFDGGLQLRSGAGLTRLDRLADFDTPEALGDVLVDPDPFGDGREATGASILATRSFLDVVKARVGETLAVRYQIGVSATTAEPYYDDAAAIADFSRTFDAFASTRTEGASLAMIHAVAIPEPGRYLLMIAGLGLVLIKVRQRRAWSQ